MRKCVNKKLTALFLAAVMGGSLCADMTVFAEETTGQELVKNGSKGLENVQAENENNELEEKAIAVQGNAISLQSMEGKCGENLTYSLDEATGTLTINGTGDMYDREVWTPQLSYTEKLSLSKVILGNGITNIGNEAFFGCNNLVDIDIPNSVTEIGRWAFDQCIALEDIKLPDSLEKIGLGAFEGCSSLQNIIIPDSVTEIGGVGGGVFLNCTSLQNITIPDGVTEIGESMFCGCSALEDIKLPDSLELICPHAFDGCRSLKSIYIPQRVERLDAWAFYFNDSLESIDVAAENPEYTSQDSVLYNKEKTYLMRYPEAKKEAQFNIPDGVKNIAGRAFAECFNLQKVVFPSSVTEIEADTFEKNINLEEVVLPEGLERIAADAFRGCDKLMSLTIPKSVSQVEDYAYGYKYAEDGTEDADLRYPDAKIKCYPNTAGYKYAIDNGFDYELLEDTSSGGNEGTGSGDEGTGSGNEGTGSGGNEGTGSGDEGTGSGDEGTGSGSEGTGSGSEGTGSGSEGTGSGGNVSAGTEVSVSGISISGISKKIAAGKQIRLTVNVSPSNATDKSVTWTSSNSKVATVNSKGVVTINKKAGGKSVTITATAADGSGKKATYKITVMKGIVKKVAISGNKTVKAGKILKLKAKATATKKANKTLKWKSSNKKYATVSSSGKVKTYKAGKGKKVKITAVATDGSGKKKSVTIKIK